MDARVAQSNRLAVVLTGGGARAAYQEKRLLLLTLPFIVLSCAQALQEHPQPKAAPLASGITINDASRPKLALDELQPAEVVQAVEATFRLNPDRRFLAAIA